MLPVEAEFCLYPKFFVYSCKKAIWNDIDFQLNIPDHPQTLKKPRMVRGLTAQAGYVKTEAHSTLLKPTNGPLSASLEPNEADSSHPHL